MSEGKTKRVRFLAEHPLCFFCSAPAETIDHVPSRQCFYNGIGPEGFEFPACKRCNNSAGPTEQVVALYLHMANQDATADSSIGQFEKLVRGVQNNAPAWMPRLDLSANYKRSAAKRIGYVRGPSESYADAPIVELPNRNRDTFRVFARRLTCALYYRHTGQPLPNSYKIRTEQLPVTHAAAEKIVTGLFKLMPGYVAAKRQNTNIGDQFRYRYVALPEKEIFAFLAQFSASYFVFGAASGDRNMTAGALWLPHAEDVEAMLLVADALNAPPH